MNATAVVVISAFFPRAARRRRCRTTRTGRGRGPPQTLAITQQDANKPAT